LDVRNNDVQRIFRIELAVGGDDQLLGVMPPDGNVLKICIAGCD
jgi:hypothetical protein